MIADRLCLNNLCLSMALCIDERRVGMPLSAKAFHIDLRCLQLWLEGEAFPLNEQRSILENHCVATIDDILCRLAETAATIDVATHGTCTLLCDQRAQVVVLADELVARRAVQDNLGSGHRQVVAGRNGSPDVFAYLHAKLGTVHRAEHLGLGRQRNGCTGQIDVGRIQVLGGGKPAFLVELIVVGQVRLGDDTQQRAVLHDSGTVEQ